MPRKARIDAPGALHHIIIRGIERKNIFRDSQDHNNFLTRMGNVLSESQTPCFAWALMPNHVHLLIRTNEVVSSGIELGSRPELTGGGLVRSAGGWSALKAMRSTACRIMGDERILGGSEFVEAVLRQSNEGYEKRTYAISKGLQIKDVIERVSEATDIATDFVKGPGKQRKASRARAIVCYLSVDKLGFKSIDVACVLKMSPSAVSKAIPRGRSDKDSREIWEGLLEKKKS